MSSPDKNGSSTITGSRFVGGNITQGTNSVNLHAMLYSTTDKNMTVYFVKHVLLFQKQNLVNVPFTLQANKKQGVLRWFLMWRWLYGPYETTLLKLTDM